jgi:hypothetical protein
MIPKKKNHKAIRNIVLNHYNISYWLPNIKR